MSANNVARIGSEQIESNSELLEQFTPRKFAKILNIKALMEQLLATMPRKPIGIGACIAHLRLALEPVRSDLGLANDWLECEICNYRYDIDRSAI